MLEHVRAVLFDLDGTLVDSMWMWGQIDVEYLGRHGLALPEGLQRTIEGMSFSETAVYFKEHFAIAESLDEIKAEWVEMAKDKYAREVQFKPGALDFLQELKSRGVRTAIATSNSRELLEAVREALGLDRYIDCYMTACEAGAGKPAPDIYRKVAEKLQVAPADCLVFEDTLAGMQAGAGAGIPVCAVEDPYSGATEEEMRRYAAYCIRDFTQVLDGSWKVLK